MKFVLSNNTITIILSGRIDSNNHEKTYSEIKDILVKNTFESLVLDFKEVEYISSAGLRVMLKLKKEYDSLAIINTSIDVYDIFEMTGFTQLMDVKKATKFISVKGAEVIGSGYFSTVYRVDPDTIIKVFNITSDEEQIDRELRRAKDAFVGGIPTAISFDIVDVEDGKKGVRFELLNSKCLRDCFRDDKAHYNEWLSRYIDLLKTINSTKCKDPNIIDIKKFYIEKVEYLKDYLKDDYKKAMDLIQSVEDRDTFVHGDCHFKNILVQNDELLLIDMDTLSKGHPIFELSALRFAYMVFNEFDKGNSLRFFGMEDEFCEKLYNDVVEGYLGKLKGDEKDKIAFVSYLQMCWWNRVEKDSDEIFNNCFKRMLSYLNKLDNLNI